MKLTLAEPRFLKDSVSIISDLITEARFKVTKQSLQFVAMDPANVAMVVFELFSTSFTEYLLEEEEDFAVNLSYFKQILKRAGSNDTVTLELVEDKLKVQLKGKSTRTFSLAVLESEDREQKEPSLEFGSTITTPSNVLNDTVEDAAVIMADSISFVSEPKKITFLAESDLNQVKIELTEADDVVIQHSGESTIKAKYSIEYLKKIVASSKLSDTVKLSFAKDYPMKLEYSVVDKLHLSFILAPRVEND